MSVSDHFSNSNTKEDLFISKQVIIILISQGVVELIFTLHMDLPIICLSVSVVVAVFFLFIFILTPVHEYIYSSMWTYHHKKKKKSPRYCRWIFGLFPNILNITSNVDMNCISFLELPKTGRFETEIYYLTALKAIK